MKKLVNCTSKVVTACRFGHYPSLFPIRSGEERTGFAIRNEKFVTLTIYNTGRRLYRCPGVMPANSYYLHVPWMWLRFADFSDGQNSLVVTDRNFGGYIPDKIPLCLKGHDKYCNASIQIGEIWSHCTRQLHKSFVIPRMFILYVSMQCGTVKDSLLVYHPLPIEMFKDDLVAKKVSWRSSSV